MFDEEKGGLNNQVLTIDEAGIGYQRGDGRVSSHYAWSSFIKRIDMQDAYVFLPSPNSFIRIAREALSDEERKHINAWSSHVPSEISGSLE